MSYNQSFFSVLKISIVPFLAVIAMSSIAAVKLCAAEKNESQVFVRINHF